MKKIILSSLFVLLSVSQMFAMSNASMRNHARFLTDRMAYELDLTPRQYDDLYEINLDFIYMADRIMDDVVYGYRDAIDRYYDLLDMRNDDIHYVLTSRQYRRFLSCEYFYRPIYTSNMRWYFGIYTVYNNRKFFYYDAPMHYKTYLGEHSRHRYGKPDYYASRYAAFVHDRYTGHFFIQKDNHHKPDIHKNDFGTNIRERNNPSQNRINNYSNRKEQNRTENPNYRDNSGNKNAPAINNRSQSSTSKSTSTRTQSSAGSTTRQQTTTGSTTRSAVSNSSSGNTSTRSGSSSTSNTSTRSGSSSTRSGSRR